MTENKQEYTVFFSDIEKKVFELESLIDDSRFTKMSLITKYGWRITIDHPKRDKIFMDTGKIVKFVPEEKKNGK